jgi:hypothetical protein
MTGEVREDFNVKEVLTRYGLVDGQWPPKAIEASAVGDVVKVPPHWHVKCSVSATRATEPIPTSFILAGDPIELAGLGGVQVFEAPENAFETDGVIVFDLAVPFKPAKDTTVRICSPRAGVSARGSIIDVT